MGENLASEYVFLAFCLQKEFYLEKSASTYFVGKNHIHLRWN
jgi:hypothetical protein